MTRNPFKALAVIREQGSRIDVLEAEVEELRRHYSRMAELIDVVQELLIPIAQRDETRIADAIETFNRSL